MRIALGTIEVDDETRKAIARHYGLEGMAPRDVCRRFLVSLGTGELENLDYGASAAETDDDG